MCKIHVRRVWRYQRGNQNPYIVQWPKEKVQNDIQRSTKHTHKTKDRVTRTTLKTGGELMCSGRVGGSCSTSGTPRVKKVKWDLVIPCKLIVLWYYAMFLCIVLEFANNLVWSKAKSISEIHQASLKMWFVTIFNHLFFLQIYKQQYSILYYLYNIIFTVLNCLTKHI